MGFNLEKEVAVVKTMTSISNNPVFKEAEGSYISSVLQDHNIKCADKGRREWLQSKGNVFKSVTILSKNITK